MGFVALSTSIANAALGSPIKLTLPLRDVCPDFRSSRRLN